MVWNCRCHRQPAGASGDRKETLLRDGLALIRRDGTNFVNEPAVTGGNPVIAGDKTLFNDMLGSTLGAKTGGEFSVIERDAFGQTETASDYDFFTGKPHIGELGYAFLFRNYRANLGKWQTADPMGYPDGWNNLAYVRNKPVSYIDFLGYYSVVSVKEPGSDIWYGPRVTSSNQIYYYASDDPELPRAFLGNTTPSSGADLTCLYYVNDDGSVRLDSAFRLELDWSGEIESTDPFGKRQFKTSGSIRSGFSVTEEAGYDDNGEWLWTKYYLKVVIHFEINSTTDAAKRNITFPSEKVIGEFWLNTVMRE